jgi:hypothetical protein
VPAEIGCPPILARGLEPYLARQAAPRAAEAGAIGGIVRGQ